jgi:hypothetical protein
LTLPLTCLSAPEGQVEACDQDQHAGDGHDGPKTVVAAGRGDLL